MIRYIYILIWLLSPVLLSAQNNVTQAEYWFDGQYSSVVTTDVGPTTNLTLNSMIDVSGLVYGLHTVTYRFKDNRGIWGPVLSKFFTYYSGSATPTIHDVTHVEYWYDNDYTNATNQPVGPGTDLVISELLDVGLLINGLHTITYRFKDDRNIWSSTQSKFFTKYINSGIPAIHDVIEAEYWYDNDYANATIQAVGPGDDLLISELLDVGSLIDGLHTFTYRFKDDRNIWSSIQTKFFTKNVYSDVALHEIVSLEYWYDNDYSNVVQNDVTATNSLDVNEMLDVSGLSTGIHVVNSRFQDDAGKWSPVSSWFFSTIVKDDVVEMHKITAFEYWYNNDYSSVQKETIAATQDFSIDETLNVSALDIGLHFVNYRFQDETGEWSSVYSKFFSNYPELETPTLHKITALEYWFNGDNSSAVKEEIESTENFVLDENIDVSGLVNGLHFVSYRFQDEGGNWSSVVSKMFSNYPAPETTTMREITTLEYWFDGDKSTSVARTNAETEVLALDESVDIKALGEGLHSISYRFKDKSGSWSSAFTKFFSYFDDVVLAVDNKIVGYRYWADENISASNEVMLTTPIKSLLLDELIDVSNFPSGEHLASFQFVDEQGNWSVAVSQTYTKAVQPFVKLSAADSSVCENSTVQFYAEIIDADVIEWNFGDGNTSSEINPLHSYNLAGDYVVSAIVTHTDSVKSASSTIVGGITIYPSFDVNSSNEICASELPYTFGTQTLVAAGIYTEIFPSVYGCDSTVTLTLTVNPVYDDTQTETICASELPYDFGTQSLTASGEFTEVFTTIDNCDSTVTLTLTVNPVYDETTAETICASELPYVFGTQSLTASGEFTEVFTSVDNCDSTVTLTLTVNPVYDQTKTKTICDSDLPYTFGTQSLLTAGDYTETFLTTLGCDSVINLTLIVNDQLNESVTEEICVNDLPFVFGSQTLSAAGDYTETFVSANGCDSVVDLTLNVNPTYSESVSESVCDNELPFVFGSQSLSAEGDYTETFQSVSGCDSVVTLTLTVNSTHLTTDSETICESELPFEFGTQTITTAGDFTETFQSVLGCDSMVVLTLTVNPTYAETEAETICDSELPFVFGTQTLTSGGIYTETFQSISGCDSVVELTLTVNPTYAESVSESVCDNELPFVFGSQSLSAEGDYTETFQSVSGCDSVVTLTLTVNSTHSTTVSETICESELPFEFGTQTITTAGDFTETFQSVLGCDSTVYLTLTVLDTFETNITETICDSELPYVFGSQTIFQAGTVSEIYSAINGCDSTVVLTLMVNSTYDTQLNVNIDEDEFPYTFGTLQILEAGIYKDTLLSISGCDSIVTLNLTDDDDTSPIVLCNSIDVYLDESSTYELTIIDIENLSEGTSDNRTSYDNLTINVKPEIITCKDVGRVKVQVIAFDEAGNRSFCYVWVYVYNEVPVKFEPVSELDTLLEAGICETKIIYPDLEANGNCLEFKQLDGLGPDGLFPLGTTVETWEVSNNSGDADTISFDVSVEVANAIPTIDAIPDMETNEDTPVNIQLSGISDGGDCAEQLIEVRVSNNDAELIESYNLIYTSGNTSGILEIIPVQNKSGTTSFKIDVEDEKGAIFPIEFAFNVKPVNDPPRLVHPIPDTTINASYEIAIPLSEVLGIIFDDADQDPIQLSLSLLEGVPIPEWVSYTSEILTAVPMIADTGSYSFVVTASDLEGAMATDTFVLYVAGYPTGIGQMDQGNFAVTMYPNPSKGEVNLKINASEIKDAEVIVRSITGSEVFRKKYKAAEKIQIDLSNQVSGVYLITLKYGDRAILKKLIIARK